MVFQGNSARVRTGHMIKLTTARVVAQGPVFQREDHTIHLDKLLSSQNKLLYYKIVSWPVDSVIHPLNNRGQQTTKLKLFPFTRAR